MTVNVVDAGPRQVSRSVEVDAPAADLYAMAADPRRHSELDGSGTVRDNIKVPANLAVGSKFSTKMKMYGLPYRITSRVTALKPNELFEWRHADLCRFADTSDTTRSRSSVALGKLAGALPLCTNTKQEALDVRL